MKKFGIDCRLKDGSLTERTYLLTLSGTGDPPSYPPSSFHLSSTELFASDLDQLTATESISARNSDSLFSTAISRLKYPLPPLPPDSFQKNQRWSKRRKYRSSRSEATVSSLLPPSLPHRWMALPRDKLHVPASLFRSPRPQQESPSSGRHRTNSKGSSYFPPSTGCPPRLPLVSLSFILWQRDPTSL
jgi:hypothetical protein